MVTVERASWDRADEVRSLLAAFARAVGEPPPDAEAWRRIAAAAQRDEIRFYLAREGTLAIGVASMTLGFSTYHGAPFAHFDDLYVVPDRRGRGVARLLLQALQRAALERGCASAMGGCSAGDVAMWEHLGFRRIGTLMAVALEEGQGLAGRRP